MAVQQEVVHIDGREQSAATIHLNVSQRTDVVGSTSHIEGIVHGREGRKGIGAWHLHLSDDADGDCTRLP